MLRRAAYRWAAPLCLAYLALAAQEPQAPVPGRLNLVVVEGEGAINNIRLRTSRETIVQVEDENHRPIAGAAVVFLLPSNGPGGTFINGANSVTLTTDAAGRATMPAMTPNPSPGQYQICVHVCLMALCVR